MNLDEFTDQQERINRLDAVEHNAEWLRENWEDAHPATISKRLGLIKGDTERLVEMASEPDRDDGDTDE